MSYRQIFHLHRGESGNEACMLLMLSLTNCPSLLASFQGHVGTTLPPYLVHGGVAQSDEGQDHPAPPLLSLRTREELCLQETTRCSVHTVNPSHWVTPQLGSQTTSCKLSYMHVDRPSSKQEEGSVEIALAQILKAEARLLNQWPSYVSSMAG